MGPTREGESLTQNRPLLVSFESAEDKVKVMKNLHSLQNAEESLKALSVSHDMSKEERSLNNKLRAEAKQLNNNPAEENFTYVVRGDPWNRKIVKIKKRNS